MNFIQALHEQGYEVVIIAPVDDFIKHLSGREDLQFIPIQHLSRKTLNPFKDIRLLLEFYRIYKKWRPDLILHYTIKPNIYGSIASTLSGLRSSAVIPGLGYSYSRKGVLRSFVRILYRIVMPLSDFVFFENQEDRKDFVQSRFVKGDQAIALKGCGVDITHFAPKIPPSHNGRVVFLFMGRLIRDKGIYEFVEAAKIIHDHFPESEYWIMGHIDEHNPNSIGMKDFMSWVEHPNIRYLGFEEDVRSIIKDVDCVVLPSYYPEGVPRVLQEGMAMAKPIITTDAKGCREAVDDSSNGLLVVPRDIKSLAGAMEKICLMEPHEREAMGAAGRKKAIHEFDEQISIRVYLECIRHSLGEAGHLTAQAKRKKRIPIK